MVIRNNYKGKELCEVCKEPSTIILTEWHDRKGVVRLKHFCKPCMAAVEKKEGGLQKVFDNELGNS